MLPVRQKMNVPVREHGRNAWMPIANALRKRLPRRNNYSCLMTFFGLVPDLKYQMACALI